VSLSLDIPESSKINVIKQLALSLGERNQQLNLP